MEFHIADIPCVPEGHEAVVRIALPAMGNTAANAAVTSGDIKLCDIEDYIYVELIRYFELDTDDGDARARLTIPQLLECKLHFRRIAKAFIARLQTRLA